MTLPAPSALRLVCRAPTVSPPATPLGLRAFTDDPAAEICVLLDIDPETPEREQVDAACAQIPDAADLPAGRLVIVLPERAKGRGLLTRLFGGTRAHVSCAVRATALLARGYSEIGAEAGLVWGKAPVYSTLLSALAN